MSNSCAAYSSTCLLQYTYIKTTGKKNHMNVNKMTNTTAIIFH